VASVYREWVGARRSGFSISRQTGGVEGRSGSQLVKCYRGGSSGHGCDFVSVVEDFSNGGVLGNESEDFHFAAALGTGQRVDLVDAVDELAPSLGESSAGRVGLVRFWGRVVVSQG